ncbi:FIST N-terminal domain-containing protein [Pontivivens ytuae]|uniref:FIST C-terminal domain-containing protein n=1 Tax=Pontivivens ytuae TaxID=2789856 RepID=A0A7S9QBY7_9RHOB|nr:FIST N-terminal domain-containing protein [Pontivivens ytuae]QPH53658.1 FIST C-terminal domain-containing protein [Pontivivens ytuae]
MDGIGDPSLGSVDECDLVLSAEAECRDPNAIDTIAREIGNTPLAVLFLFVSPEADFAAVMQRATVRFADTKVIGCTTAGEIGAKGYDEGRILAVGLPLSHFVATTLVLDDLENIDNRAVVRELTRRRSKLGREAADWTQEFAFLISDGLSIKEDELVASMAAGLGPIPLFGGSAGDGERFENTSVSIDGQVMQNAAVLTLVRTRCRIRVFSLDHLKPTDRRMVVTEAIPEKRIARQINAEPAAREYARLLGKDPEQLDPFTFAAHPVVVRFGGQHHVRAIQRVAENGDLIFFSAIDEGLVLTLAEADDMAAHLERELAQLSRGRPPAAILACDCLLRKIEAAQRQQTTAISRLLARHRVLGFSTYGEQIGAMHVNQTMTGVALYPPDEDKRS